MVLSTANDPFAVEGAERQIYDEMLRVRKELGCVKNDAKNSAIKWNIDALADLINMRQK